MASRPLKSSSRRFAPVAKHRRFQERIHPEVFPPGGFFCDFLFWDLSGSSNAGYTGFVGIEYEGSKLSEADGIEATKKLFEKIRTGR